MTGLTGSSPAMPRINLVSNRCVPIGNLGLFLHLDRRIPAGMFLPQAAEKHIKLRAGTGVTRLTGSSPAVVRINLVDDRGTPIGNLEVDVDPHGADFRPTGELPSCTNEEFSTAIPSRSGCYAGP